MKTIHKPSKQEIRKQLELSARHLKAMDEIMEVIGMRQTKKEAEEYSRAKFMPMVRASVK